MRLQDIDKVDWRKMEHPMTRAMTGLDFQLPGAAYLMALAVLFLTCCRRFNMRPLNVLERASNIMRFMDEGHTQGAGPRTLRAARMYMEKELSDDGPRQYEEEVRDRLNFRFEDIGDALG